MTDIPSAGEVFRSDDGTVSTILPTNYGEDYEPSEEELKEYAEYIGIDPAKEPALMWIAKDGLRAALPDGWRACQTDDNEVYYFNFQTGESLWDHPMDAHYKSLVEKERAKRSGSGGGTRAEPATSAAPLSSPTSTATGSTKAIADTFFLKPVTTGPLGHTRGSLTDVSGAGVAAAMTGTTQAKSLRVPGSFMNDGISAPRAPPDVSDILGLSSATSRHPAPGLSRTTANAGLSRVKEWEASLRKRLESENEAQLRTLRIELDKKADEERQRLSEARTRLQKELDAAWEQETSGEAAHSADASIATSSTAQRSMQLAREVKQIEESWKARLHDVGTRVRQLQQQVEEKQQALLRTVQQSPEELRGLLEASNAAEVAQLRETKRKEADVLLAEVKKEQGSELTKARLQANKTVAATEEEVGMEFEKKMQQCRDRNTAMLAALQEAVATKQAIFAEKEKAAAAGAAASGASSAATMPSAPAESTAQGTSSDGVEAVIAEAQAAADAEVAKAREASAAATARLREEYASRKREKELALEAAQVQRNRLSSSLVAQEPNSGTSIGLSNPGGSSGVPGISAENQAKLDEEVRKLRDEADRAARIFEEETKLMVENKRSGRPLTATPLGDVAASVSAEAIAALSRTANQEQRVREAENTRHFMAVKQLEAKHDQAVRAMKAQLEKNLASSSSSSAPAAFNPRQQPSFNAQLTARKRAWLRDHPAPSAEMPKLPPVPALPAATLESEMTALCMPSEDEQARLINSRLAEVREEVQEEYDMEAQSLQQTREKELETWKDTYRSSRVAEVQKALDGLRRAAAAKAKAGAEAEAEAAIAGEERRLEKLQSELQQLEAAIVTADDEHESQMRGLEQSISVLETSLAQLRAQSRREEEAKAEQLHLRQQQRLMAEYIGKSPTASQAPAPSSVLYISEEEAAGEVAALHARWTSLIRALRAAVQQEMEAYGRALEESSSKRNSASSAGATATRPPGFAAASACPRSSAPVSSTSTSCEGGTLTHATSSLPPPAPFSSVETGHVSLGQPPALHRPPKHQPTSSYAFGTNSAILLGCSTPLPRHLLDQDDSVACSTSMGGAVPRVSVSSPTPRPYRDARSTGAGAHGTLSVQHLGPSRSPHSQPDLLWPEGRPLSCADDPLKACSQHRDPSQSAGTSSAARPAGVPPGPSAQQITPAFADRVSYTGGSVMDNVCDNAAATQVHCHAARLFALQQLVRTRRHALQARRLEIEALREEWRADMHACKKRGDRAQAALLREAKVELEVRARQLNEEVLRLRGMHDVVQGEIRQLFRLHATCTHPEDQVARRGEACRSPTSSSKKIGDVVELLQSMVNRTERLEELLLMRRLETHSPSLPPS
ncbi:hypothetical protein JKF63_05503 [Porcisia hertigi]|uniref:WW domain-containing protein n=1 Tax=Porcisia hertigi TaxID=2761500 RepID=A0A836ILJ4_9TRYP|nr:hypothetical protein JKF63_05503 [Porcisia hertigi]